MYPMCSSTSLGETGKAIADLSGNYSDIFSCLQIKGCELQRWAMEDVSKFLEGGRLWRPEDVHRPAAISAIEGLLSRRLSYTARLSATAFRGLQRFRGPRHQGLLECSQLQYTFWRQLCTGSKIAGQCDQQDIRKLLQCSSVL